MIALTHKDKILYSWIYKPLTEEMCFAVQNAGSFIDDKKIPLLQEIIKKNNKFLSLFII